MPRNSSGTYTLPAGNPVAPNTIIETAWANPTMSDLGAAITDSLDRFGRGSMLAPIKAPDGTNIAPVYSFSAEATMGLYRATAGVMGFAVAGLTALSLSATAAVFDPAVHPQWATNPTGPNDLVRNGYLTTVLTTGYLPLTGGVLTGPGNLQVNGVLGVGAAATFPFDVAVPLAQARLNSTTGTNAAEILFARAGVLQGSLSAIGTAGQSITGSAVGDLAQRVTAGRFLWSVDAGATVVATMGPKLLDVAGTIRGTGGETTGLAVGLRLVNSTNTGGGSVTALAGASAGLAISADAGPMTFLAGGALRATLDAAGNLAIGSPAAGVVGLAVGNTARVGENYIRNVTSTNDLYFGQSSGVIFGIASGQIGILAQALAKPLGIGTLAASDLIFGTAGVETARLDAAGNFGIGAAAVAGRLYVTTSAQQQAVFNGTHAQGTRIDWRNSGTSSGFVGSGPSVIFGVALGDFCVSSAGAGALVFGTAGTERMRITAAGVIQDAGALELGYRAIPRVDQAGGSAANTIRGKMQLLTTTAAYTIPANVFTNGDVFSICNGTASAVTITQGASLVLTLAGTASTGNRSLAPNGIATVWFVNATAANISGNVS